MMNDIAERLGRLQTHTAGVAALMASAWAGAPASARGRDATESVEVTIDDAGLPTTVSIEPEWEEELAPAALGGAVLEAYTAAVADGMSTWSAALEQGGWQTQVDELRERDAAGPSSADPLPSPAVVAAPASSGVAPPDLGTLLEEAIGSLQASRARAAEPAVAPLAAGKGGGGRVTVELTSTGLQACVIDASWATNQEADTLVSAISGALRAARADLDLQSVSGSTDAPADTDGAGRDAQLVSSDASLSNALAALSALTAAPQQQPEEAR